MTRRGSDGRATTCGLILALLITLAGCAPAFRADPQLEQRARGIRTIALVPPNVRVYQLAAGGVRELMDEWTATAAHNVTNAVAAELSGASGFTIKPFPGLSDLPASEPGVATRNLKTDLEETQALFEAISTSIVLFPFPEKGKGFDYSLGPDVGTFAKLADADALLFVSGFDHVSSGGRKTLMALGVLMVGVTGVYVGPGGGTAALTAALVDGTTGDILWHNFPTPSSGYDLRNPESAAALVSQLFEGFPGRRRREAESRRSF